MLLSGIVAAVVWRADLSRDEAAEVWVDVFHEGHVEQRETRLHGSQDVSVTGQWMVSPLWLSPGNSSQQIQVLCLITDNFDLKWTLLSFLTDRFEKKWIKHTNHAFCEL